MNKGTSKVALAIDWIAATCVTGTWVALGLGANDVAVGLLALGVSLGFAVTREREP